jgi:signal transduction histidine kinase
MERPARQPPAISAHRAGTSEPLRRLAHELNSLLDGSMRSLRLLRREPGDALLFGRLAAIEGGLEEMSKLLASALVAGRDPAPERIWSLPRSVQGMLEAEARTLGGLADEHGVRVRIDCDAEAATLPAGPLEHLVRNALRNAIEACGSAHAGGDVCLSATVRSGVLALSIVDDGPGFAEQGRPSRLPTKAGHGLGLDIAEATVARLGGTLSLSNVPFGHGAVLRADVPVASLLRTARAGSANEP